MTADEIWDVVFSIFGFKESGASSGGQLPSTSVKMPLLSPAFLLAALPLTLCNPLAPRQSSSTLTVDLSQRYQEIDGFGFSEAFQRAYNIYNLPEPKRSQLVDLLFNTTTGAGFSIVRNGIGSSTSSQSDWMNTFEPASPGNPVAEPKYVWDGKDSGQLWVSQQAVGVTPLLAGWHELRRLT